MSELQCSFCKRVAPNDRCIERHHLIPRSKGGKETVPVCIDCGNQVHQLFSLNEMRDIYNNVDAIIKDERMQRWIRWIRKKQSFGMCMARKKRKL